MWSPACARASAVASGDSVAATAPSVRTGSSTCVVIAGVGLGSSGFAEFDLGMHNLPGESLAFASRVLLHRPSFLVSIGCSTWIGVDLALIDLIGAMQIVIWMQQFGATQPRSSC